MAVRAAISVSAALVNLVPAATYHFRLVAEGSGATSYGTDQTFTTAAATSVTPAISAVSQSHRIWRRGNKLATLAGRRPPVGTTFSFTLSQPATVTFTFAQRVAGRSAGHRCVAPTRANRRKARCTRMLTRGALTFAARAGAQKLSFQGKLSRSRQLQPGTYSLSIVARNAAGQASPAAQLTFTIVK